MSAKTNTEFQRVKKSRIFQNIVDQIRDAIFERRLNPGDMLPPERQLRETFNVSRGTLREALRVLEYMGLIEIKLGTGGGISVKQAGMEQLKESLTLLIRSGSLPISEIGEFREGIEGKIAALAAKRASEDDIKDLEELIGSAVEFKEQGLSAWEDFLDVDRRIHKKFAQISKNSLYSYSARIIHDNIRKYYDKYLDNTVDRMSENLEDLKSIVDAVKNHLPREAARFAENHVHRFNIRMGDKSREAERRDFFKNGHEADLDQHPDCLKE